MTGYHISHLALVEHMERQRKDVAHADRPSIPDREPLHLRQRLGATLRALARALDTRQPSEHPQGA
jgi:hypothetical protein